MTVTAASARYVHVPEPGVLETTPETDAEPGAGEVIVDIGFCGICATDTHGYQSAGLPPAVFGHEWMGTVAAVGSGVTHLRPGQRVIAGVGPACGICAQCRVGHADNCDLAFAEANGISPGAAAHGGFADRLRVSARRAIPVPEALSDVEAALMEPATVTYHAVRRARVPLGATVVIQGAGPIGLLTAQHARAAGAGRILVSEPSPARREAATALGFTDVLAPESLGDRLTELTDGLGADIVFECSGVASLLQPSAELVRRGGTLALLGYPGTDSSVSYGDWQSRELTVIGSLAYTHSDFIGAMTLVAEGRIDLASLHTGTIGLGDLESMFAELDSGRSSHTKVLVDPRR
ncbi:zinc-dependent alcohol dehydrogenase [Gordonia terrae]|uniref:Alcohol dehydrogenase n=2 Tax=Gordonia terrae TaxID=2055 RepID=A0AAD0KB62_9ACTN|nr:zinc-binding dehydrogenase [Gordonia terrae]VTR08425.1 theronine dehydrogenase-like Zn-dependent dehydrogenase [Clostridioides difficile]ANY25488.1 alcohol dehydrogenase [Gordonia terrae]AWO86236.1 alcohol dehydrogenase [Gordonia terrae]VTS63549.1 Sorbitol dehydrogenase [Gordonia terrae]GAB43644.1 putative zinc-containing alcohol dehydrogenase [Gordonia terrae NBRC 100016]